MKASLEKAQEARRAGARVLDPTQKHLEKPKSRTLAIKAKCYECQGYNSDPCWQWRVGNCEIKGCALYSVRPYQKMEGSPTPAALRCED